MLSEILIAGGDHFPSDGTGFSEPGFFEPFTFSPKDQPVFSFSDSDNSTPKTNSSDEVINAVDERRKRRKISNRESAQRSRVRKQKHVENLKSQLNRYKTGNKDLTNRFRVLNIHANLIRDENRKLRLESLILEQKLWAINQMGLRQLRHQLLQNACMNLQ